MVAASRAERGRKKEISWQAVYYHFRKWSGDGSLQRVFERSLDASRSQIDTKHINLDGSHALAKKAVAGTGGRRRKRPTSSMTDAKGFILATTGLSQATTTTPLNLKTTCEPFQIYETAGHSSAGSYFNADAAFDTKAARWTCFNHKLIPNIVENARSRKRAKRGRNAIST